MLFGAVLSSGRGNSQLFTHAFVLAIYLSLSLRRPCHHVPSGKATDKVIEATDANHPRIEEAFQKYFYRAPYPEEELEKLGEKKDAEDVHVASESDKKDLPEETHEFEIIVCHANVIRYFLCRYVEQRLGSNS
jgi:serine/threonine-protein phosphatase PGAM5